MIILLVLFLLVLVYCLIPGRIQEPWRTWVLVGLCAAALIVTGVQYFFGGREGLGVTSAKYPRAAAYMLGKQMLKDIKKKGEVVVVVNELAKWASDRQLEGLKQALDGSGLKMSAPRYETFAGEGSAVAPGKLKEISAENPDAVAIVTFLGVPELRDADKDAGLPPVYVFQTGEADDGRPWLEAGIVWGACFYKDAVNWDAAPARMSGLESAFKDRFKLATPGDVSGAKSGTK